jgi:hypothetical protein
VADYGDVCYFGRHRVASIPASLSTIVQEAMGMNILTMLQPMTTGRTLVRRCLREAASGGSPE